MITFGVWLGFQSAARRSEAKRTLARHKGRGGGDHSHVRFFYTNFIAAVSANPTN